MELDIATIVSTVTAAAAGGGGVWWLTAEKLNGRLKAVEKATEDLVASQKDFDTSTVERRVYASDQDDMKRRQERMEKKLDDLTASVAEMNCTMTRNIMAMEAGMANRYVGKQELPDAVCRLITENCRACDKSRRS